MLSAVPYGASSDDTAEFMLGDVVVSVVLLESDGTIDEDLENWQPSQIDRVKQRVNDSLQWWENQLAKQNSVHSLNFITDFTFAEQPIQTGYEPIGRPSDDFELWIEDFFDEVGVETSGSFSDQIRQFNHLQRLAYDTNWAFTLFVVNADQDRDSRFDTSGSFSQSFAFAGGRFFVTTSERPASSIAHEVGHMFWAMDEYPGGRAYIERRGYYGAQNLNAFDGNPNPDSRVRSIMDSTAIGYSLDQVSPSALEMIGWRDSDGNGVFDVLDVPSLLVGTGSFDLATRQYDFEGFAQVQTLANLNRSGTGNDMTINRIDRIEVRFDGSEWQSVAEIDAYQADLNLSVTVPPGAVTIDVRAVDGQSGVSSNIFRDALAATSGGWQNVANPADVNGDTFVAPLDALLVINQLNAAGSRPLGSADRAPPFLDVNGDGFLSPLDALIVINTLNTVSRTSETPIFLDDASGEGERRAQAEFAGLDQRDRDAAETAARHRRNANDGTGDLLPDHAARASRRGRRLIPPNVGNSSFSHESEPARSPQRNATNGERIVDLAILELLATESARDVRWAPE